jgi:hypothetical protein
MAKGILSSLPRISLEAHRPAIAAPEERGNSVDLATIGESVVRVLSVVRVFLKDDVRLGLYNAMGRFVNSDREAVITESWKRTLSAIPTLIGRIAYLSSLRNVNSGSYEHFGLAQRIGADEVDRILRRSHMSVFQEWLCFGLERQKEELEEYFSGLEGDKREIIANWSTLEPWNNWVPGESRDVERKLFNADLAVVLELVRVEYGVSSRDPDS